MPTTPPQEAGEAATGERSARSAADLVDPTVERRLGARAAAGLTAVLAAAIGATTTGGLWISTNGLRAQAEEAGRQSAVTAATAFATLAEPSAANVARTLDIVLDEQLQAQAAATALLIEAAETAGHRTAYIEDALRQIAARSPIRRIDVTARSGASYSTEPVPLDATALEPAFAALTSTGTEGRTAATPATQTAAGLTKAAAAQTMHRPAAVRLEQELDGLAAARTYGGADDRAARELADRQTAAVARLITHAVELAEDAGWGRARIRERLDQLVRTTSIERILATGADGRAVYEAGASEAGRGGQHQGETEIEALSNESHQALPLPGRYDNRRRWIASAAATRANGRLAVTVDMATRAGEGSLVESAWQAEANRLAEVDGITAVWVAETIRTGGPDGRTVRLATAAPGLDGEDAGRSTAWTRWRQPQINIATRTARTSTPVSTARIRLAGSEAATVLSAAPAGLDDGGRSIAVIIENRAEGVVGHMRREAAAGLAVAAGLIAVMAIMTTWTARRWLTGPVEAVAGAARCLRAGERPPAGLTAGLQRRKDEIGGLARTFKEMTEHVLARHEEMAALVADRTRWLQDANEKLTAAQQRIDREIGLAKTVQQALVPGGTLARGNVTVASRMTPARELGGDFVDVQERNANELFIAVCDVSGKGVAAALFMAVAQAALASAAAANRKVGDIADDANRRLCTSNPLGMFVTAFIGTLDTAGGQLEYVCAGHEPPIAVSDEGKLRKLEGTGAIPFGLEPDEQYRKREYQMRPDETIVAYTDGVTDACNRNEEAFGERRLEELVTQTHADPPERILTQLWTATEVFSGPAAATDDKTCMVIRRHAGAKPPDEAGHPSSRVVPRKSR